MKWSFFAGLGMGAAIGMMCAPKSGVELRDDLQELARKSYEQERDRLQPVIDGARGKIGPIASQVREKAGPAISEAREKARPVLDNIRESVDNVMTQASSVGDRVAG